MSGIKQPILDVMNRLKLIQVKNQDGNMVSLHVSKFKNQIEREKQGEVLTYSRPAAFVQCMNNVSYQQLGMGIRNADLGFKIHLVDDFYNDENNENFDLDLAIYDLRDRIISPEEGLSQFCPSQCGQLNCITEDEDQDPVNVNCYVLDFVCNFTDSTGSNLNNMPFEETDLSLEIEQGGIPVPEKEHNPYHIL